MLEATLMIHVAEIRERLDRAAGIAKAAQARVEAGDIKKTIKIAFEVEQLTTR